MVISVAEALDSDTAERIRIRRYDKGRYINGIYRNNMHLDTEALCSVQQPSSNELNTLPEGERDKNILKFYVKKEIKTGSDEEGLPADMIIYRDRLYKVISTEDWQIYGYTVGYGVRLQ